MQASLTKILESRNFFDILWYLRNKSSDLHEILYGGQLLSCELMLRRLLGAFPSVSWLIPLQSKSEYG